jgi:hypothetical protein
MQIIIDLILERLAKLNKIIKDIMKFIDNNDFFDYFFLKSSDEFQKIVTSILEIFITVVFEVYDFCPEWILAGLSLLIMLGPKFLWVTVNVILLFIIFIWYLTIYLYGYMIEKEFDTFIGNLILKFIIKMKYLLNILFFNKFNYNFLIEIFFILFIFFNYIKFEGKYKYDLYGNPLMLIKKSYINFFKNALYINMYVDSFYYQNKLKLDWRSILTFHIDEVENEDPEDFEQIILWPLLRFKYRSHLLKIFKSIHKFNIFNRYSKRRRFSFYYNLEKYFILYYFKNFKLYLILLIIISFFNAIILNVIIDILKYITSL